MGNIHGIRKQNRNIKKVKEEKITHGAIKLDVLESNSDSNDEEKNLANITSTDNYQNESVVNHLHESFTNTESSRFKKKRQKISKIKKKSSIKKAENDEAPLYKRLNLVHSSSIINRSMQVDITNCWQTILEKYDNDYPKIGLEIYQRIFEICPELRSVFLIPLEIVNISDHAPFHRSSKLLVSLINLCIRNIHRLEAEMGTVLTIYGRRHYLRQKQGFHVSYFAVFEKCLLDFFNDNIPDIKKKPKILEGWQLMISYIRNKMTRGIELEKQSE